MIRVNSLPSVYLKPGEAYFGRRPGLVTTVLGSCVSIIMKSSTCDAVAMCHAVLPSCDREDTCGTDCGRAFTYVRCSVLSLLDMFEKRGIGRGHIIVKVFGGSDILDENSGTHCTTVGRQNLRVVEETLTGQGLAVTAFDTGGPYGRKVMFFTDSGAVFVRRTKPVSACRDFENDGEGGANAGKD
jgi:chemotaxis protein CheD